MKQLLTFLAILLFAAGFHAVGSAVDTFDVAAAGDYAMSAEAAEAAGA